jgi:outer membrane protein assembly factor BamB
VLADELSDVEDLSSVSEILDPASGTLYTLQPRDPQALDGQWVLQATRVRGDKVMASRVVSASVGLADMYGGYLWAYDQNSHGGYLELNPVTLATIRTFQAPGGIADGGAGSVWIDAAHALLRISARTGAVLGQIALPRGFSQVEVSVSPGGALVYASGAGNGGGGTVREYSAADGRLLATTTEDWSVTSPDLVAMPGSLWIFGRTGMMGESALLSQRNLAVLAQEKPESFTGPYLWGPWADAVYADGTLWWIDSSGLLACVDPATGRVRASVTFAPRQLLYQLLAVAGGRVYGVTENGVVAITPPARCRLS